MKKLNKDFLATFLGFSVAIANAWATIDWQNFEFSYGNCMKLLLSAIIAAGGWVSTIKTKK